MSINVKARKLLWARAHNECAYPTCSQELTINFEGPESTLLSEAGAVIGEEAHIRSGRGGGPRHEPNFPINDIDKYENLILLCPTHHTIVDKNDGYGYTVEDLEQMRANHEETMRAARSTADEKRRRNAERLAASVKNWEDMMLVDDWEDLTYGLNYPTPILRFKYLTAMEETNRWLLAKDWPVEFPAAREAFGRFREVLNVMTTHVYETFEQVGERLWQLDTKYKKIGWDPPRYEELLNEFRLDCSLTWCLTTELTKAANLVIRAIREEIEPFYRFDEGLLLASEGDAISITRILRLEYTDHKWGDKFPAIDARQWRAVIQDEAEKRREDPDSINPRKMLSVIMSKSFPDN